MFLSKRDQRKVKTNLKKSRSKVSISWKGYRKQKQTIKNRYKTKSKIKEKTTELLQRTRDKISNQWNDYRGKKYTITHRYIIEKLDLDLFNTKIDKNTRSEYYQSKKGIENINDNIKTLFSKRKIKYVLIDFFYKDKETDRIRVVSDAYTVEGFERIKDKNLHDEFLEKLETQISGKTTDPLTGYEFMYYTIRAIYYK